MKNKIIKKCLFCGRFFKVSPCLKQTAKFCSKKCHNTNNARKQIKIKHYCIECGKELKNFYAKRCSKCAKMGKLNSNFNNQMVLIFVIIIILLMIGYILFY